MAVEWTDERIELLKSLWAEGLPAGEIGRRLEVTKNAVVGKVHRLGLPKRPSPIKNAVSSSTTPRAKPKKKVKADEPIRLADLGPGMCSWPIGDPGNPDFHFCGAKSIPGKPYCLAHCEKAYVRTTKGGSDSSNQSG